MSSEYEIMMRDLENAGHTEAAAAGLAAVAPARGSAAQPRQRKIPDELINNIARAMAQIVKPLRERIAELETRMQEFRYAGVWRDGGEYHAGNFITHDGGLWHANETTRSRPGRDRTFTLVAKSDRRRSA